MGNRIVGLVLLVLLSVGGYVTYQHYQTRKAEENGAVHCQGCMTPEEASRFKIENAGEGADGQSERKDETSQQTARRVAAADGATQNAAQSAVSQAGSQTAGGDASGANSAAATQPVTSGPITTGSANSTSGAASLAAPTSDSQSPNAPNGLRFAGSGSYQWYRQGNLTYRVDTTNGRSCIAYATLEEWRKQIVLSHGCGRDV